jgi:propanediol utilization protein
VVIVCPVQSLRVQCDAGIHGEGLKPFLHQLGVELAHLVAHELGLEHQERPPGNVDGDAGQRLVHRHVDAGIARDALHVAERLLHCLAERDADVLGGVMVVDMQVALGLDRDVDARVPRQ